MSDAAGSLTGRIQSADIAVPEHEKETRFYSAVLGTGRHPLWRDDLSNNLGIPIIGLGRRTSEYAQLPLQWMPHIQVLNVADSVERALGLGGRELMHGRDADGASQWAVLVDPNGAAFGITPVVQNDHLPALDKGSAPGAQVVMGRISSTRLTVADTSLTRDFYHEVIGWSVRELESAGGGARSTGYEMLDGGGQPAARVCKARDTRPLPPVWLIYLPVDDLRASLDRVREEGGEVIDETLAADGECEAAVIRDPVGAHLGLCRENAAHSQPAG